MEHRRRHIDAGGGIGGEAHEQRPELDGELGGERQPLIPGPSVCAHGAASGCFCIACVQTGDGAGKLLGIEGLQVVDALADPDGIPRKPKSSATATRMPPRACRPIW